MSTQTRGILLALLAYGIYAGHDAVIKALGAQYSAVQIVFFSVLFSFPLTSLMAMGESAPGTLRPRHPWWMALRMGAIVIASASCFYAFAVLPLADTYAILFAMPILITLLAFLLNFVIGATGLVSSVNTFVSGLDWSPLATLLVILCVYLVLGMFMDTLAMIVLTIPIVTPIVVGLGYDAIWFGVMMVLVAETSVLTPPIGMLCYVVHGIRGRGELQDVFIGVAPFIVALMVMIGLMISMPQLALWLPNLLY